MQVKICTKCLSKKFDEGFYRDKKTKDGLTVWCKACMRAAWMEWQTANHERALAASRAWKAANPERVKQIRRDHYVANVEKARADARAYHEQRRDDPEYRERKAAYKREHHQRMKDDPTYRAKRKPHARKSLEMYRARKRTAVAEYIDRLVVLERDDGVCGICGEDVDPMNFHVDHVLALACGGTHTHDNVQVAHPLCNSRKRHDGDERMVA